LNGEIFGWNRMPTNVLVYIHASPMFFTLNSKKIHRK
jgi:hypothetical protein